MVVFSESICSSFSSLKKENGAILLNLRCLSPNLTALSIMKMKANHGEELLDRTLYFAIGFGALYGGDIRHIIYGFSKET